MEIRNMNNYAMNVMLDGYEYVNRLKKEENMFKEKFEDVRCFEKESTLFWNHDIIERSDKSFYIRFRIKNDKFILLNIKLKRERYFF